MGGATPVYNGKNILAVPPRSFPFTEYLLDSLSEKLAIYNLVSGRTNFVHPPKILTSYYKLTLNMFLILTVFLQHHLFRQHNIKSLFNFVQEQMK